ncbi:hypothetical protein [Weissella confusa]|uniref:Uncharacterized protein n=1 Tax=Weissella confusa TaxID=1583 RepID=A0A4Z0S699_WEICO|nr:hypothetical protein [Weissella confusa]TGE75933.1 hypothetical protein C6P11_00260 [Weissella confusa]
MAEISDLLSMSQMESYGSHKLKIEGLAEAVKGQIQANLISQFGLGQLFDSFQDGGGVDTIHNVRNDVFSSDEVKNKIHSETSGYNKDEAAKYRGQSKRYQKIQGQQKEMQHTGNLYDPNTGKKIARNEKTDLDHTISLKEIYEDPGRVLAGYSVDEAANSKDNLKLTNSNINHSMRDDNKTDYANDLERKRSIWRAELKKVKENPNLTDEQKRTKTRNINNRLKASAEDIKNSDKASRKSQEAMYNKTYYTSDAFLKNVATNSAKQAGNQGLKSAIGAVVYQASDILFDAIIPVLKNWKSYGSMSARIQDFKVRIKDGLANLKERLAQVKDAALAGLGGGFISALVNTAINTFLTTTKNIARLLNDVARSLWQAIKILTSKDKSIPFSQKLKEAIKLVTTAVIATGGVILGEAIKVSLQGTPFAPVADVVSTAVAAILTGLVTALVLFVFDNFGEIMAQFKQVFRTMVDGIKLDVKVIERNYNAAIKRIDDIYKEILEDIYQQYAELNRLADLAFDFNLPGAEQFKASQQFAEAVGVDPNKILRTTDDIRNYFNY